MQNKNPQNNRFRYGQRDTLESDTDNSLSGFGSSLVKNVGQSFADIGNGIFDQFTGNYPQERGYDQEGPFRREAPQPPVKLDNKNLFNFRQIEEERQMSEIKELIKQIKQEVELFKRQDSSLLSEVKDIEKLTIETMPNKPGVYHVRFLEVVLKMLQALRSKIGESRTWLQALMSKKKKRGSLFASRSKEKGTQYSMSQELQASRNVQ